MTKESFSDQTDNHGTYNGSSSWFEAAAITPTGHDRIRRRHLQSNVHADFVSKKHTICLELDGSSVEDRNWISQIRPGDAIQIFPMARYPAWRNFVLSAEIEILGEMSHGSLPSPIDVDTGNNPAACAPTHGFYHPLDGPRKETRIINIHPGLREAEMVCSIESMFLDDPKRVPYQCLSYCWGDPANSKTLRVVDSITDKEYVVSVTSNLHEALHSIRRETQACMFWIDAICINQSDKDERSQQVSMMSQIYSNATGVIVWLGSSTPEVQKEIEKANYILQRFRASIERVDQPTVEEIHHPHLDGGVMYDSNDSHIFQYDWFRRTWVLQEVFNAKTVEVHCGDEVLPWWLVLRLNQCQSRAMLTPTPVKKTVMSSLLTGLFELHRDKESDNGFTWSTRQGRLPILDAVIRGLDLEATDPRDKIFALLCFGEETANVSQLPPIIAPNYTKSAGQVFADFTRWWILTHNSLRILSFVHVSLGRTWQQLSLSPPARDPGRTSWSIWHDGRSIWSLGTLTLLPQTQTSPYRASGSTTPDLSLIDTAIASSSSLTLRVRGRKITTITSLAPYPYYNDPTSTSALHTAYTAIFDPINMRAIWRSLILPAELLSQQRQHSQETQLQKLGDHFHTHVDVSRETASIECHHDALFTTHDGNTGLCPSQGRVGDVIVILDGGDVPYLLRAIGGEGLWEFVGECYLEGYMFGKAMDESETLTPEVLELT